MLSLGWILAMVFFAMSLRLTWLMGHAWDNPSDTQHDGYETFNRVSYPDQPDGGAFAAR